MKAQYVSSLNIPTRGATRASAFLKRSTGFLKINAREAKIKQRVTQIDLPGVERSRRNRCHRHLQKKHFLREKIGNLQNTQKFYEKIKKWTIPAPRVHSPFWNWKQIAPPPPPPRGGERSEKLASEEASWLNLHLSQKWRRKKNKMRTKGECSFHVGSRNKHGHRHHLRLFHCRHHRQHCDWSGTRFHGHKYLFRRQNKSSTYLEARKYNINTKAMRGEDK